MPGLDPPSILDADTIAMLPHYRGALEEMGMDTSQCSPEEIMAMVGILEEYETSGISPTAERIVAADYWKTPPTIEEFCEDDYYLGAVLEPNPAINQHGLYPKWRDEIYKAFQPGRQVNQIIITGAIGLGKTMIASIILLYRLARLLCLRNPIQYYGLARVSRLVLSCFSVTKAQVMGGAFLDMINFMGTSPFFNEILPVGDRKFSDQQISFPNNLILKAGSKVHQALGGNVLCTLIDEINFRLEKDAANAAKDLVNSLERRQESRFKQHQDTLMILISSAKAQADFLTQHIIKNRDNPKVVIWDFPLWDVRGGVTFHYCGERFLMDVGDNINPAAIVPCGDWRARAVEGTLQGDELALHRTIQTLPANRFIWVPVEHRKSFEDAPEESIRDIAGLATGRMAKLFPDFMSVINTIQDGVQNPFAHHTVKLSCDSSHYIHDCLADQGRRLVFSQGNSWRPIRHPHSPRYMHIDISTGIDALGLVMVHPLYLTEVQRIKLATQESEVMMRPVYELDFAVRIVRERITSEVDFGKVRSFILWLRDHGFNIRTVSCDLRQLSMEMRGILKKMGFNAPYLSVDIKRDAYDTLKQVVVEQRLHTHNHPYLFMEMVNLEDNVKKVDHPEKFNVPWGNKPEILAYMGRKGSKDLTDGLAGAVYAGETDTEHQNIPMYNPDAQRIVTPALAFGEEPGTTYITPTF